MNRNTGWVVIPCVQCYGPSMLPTIGLAGNNLCLAERISTRFERIGVGDIVMVRSPEAPRKTVAKRLIATEGQSVTYVVDPKNGDRSETLVVSSCSISTLQCWFCLGFWVFGFRHFRFCSSVFFKDFGDCNVVVGNRFPRDMFG